MSGVASSSRPASCSSEASLQVDYKPPSILRRSSKTPSLDDCDHTTSNSVSRRSSRVRFSETEIPTVISSPMSLHRTSSVLFDNTSRRSSLNAPSSYRAPSPSDFTPRPLPMPRYNGPLAPSLTPDTSIRRKLRPRPSADALRADLDAHRLSIPDLSRSFSSASSSSSSSRRSSNRFSILSDPDDLDLLASIGGIPDFDDFLTRALPQAKSSRPVSQIEDVPLCAPPPLPLPIPGQNEPSSPDTTSILRTPPAALQFSRALSPISGEDEKTPMAQQSPVFRPLASPSSPHPQADQVVPVAGGHGRSTSVISIAPLLVFPLPPTRDTSLEDTNDSTGLDSTGLDAAVTKSPSIDGASNDHDQASELSYGTENPTLVVEVGHCDDDVPVPIPMFDRGDCLAQSPVDDIRDERPNSPGLPEFLVRQRRSSSSSGDDADYDDDDIAFDLPLHEAAVRSGILSYQSRLIWPTKPKRRHFSSSRLLTSPVIAHAESTGWSGSESEEEEFNAVLINIGRRRLARQNSCKRHTRLTPLKSLSSASASAESKRLSIMSQSSTSSSSSVEVLTPDPHRTTFGLGLFGTEISPTPAPRIWSAPKSLAGCALGIPVPLALPSPSRQLLPAPRRQVKGWGKPEILLEDDEAPLVLSSSDEELPPLDSKEEDECLMDETEPEFHSDSDSGNFRLFVPPTPTPRNLGVPF